ncbi:MAG: 5-aminolevulinate synthase, partial [Sediminibacterium sp.]|nr:5-aminolevulinate synthase [Sediminibacterium sp.]
LKDKSNYRYFLEINKSVNHFPYFYFSDQNNQKHTAINFCSNDYLGLSINPDIIGRYCFVAHQSGVGSGGTRNISGTTLFHKNVEKKIAHWFQKQQALLFGSAYIANLSTLQTIGKNMPNLIFISDEKNHNSLIEGIKNSGNKKYIFKHNNVLDLELILKKIPPNQPKLIVFESVYSMNGNIAPIKKIVRLAKLYNALTYIDEVHAIGLYGDTGAGITEKENLLSKIDIINGTLAKSIGLLGGFITANNHIIDFIRSYANGFIFTTSIPPAICAAAEKSIDLIQCNPSLRNATLDLIVFSRKLLKKNKINFLKNNTHITIIPINNAQQCKLIADNLLMQFNIYIQPINSPTVRVGEECLRIVITAKHQEKHILQLVDALCNVLKNKNNETKN